jgi:hypothetical protein
MTTRTEEDREFAAITEKDIFDEARDRLKIADDAEGDNKRRAKTAIAFREGDQWDDEGDADSLELTINLTDAMIERVENNIRQQRPRGKCHPVGDGADIEVADVINGIGRHIETRSEASVAYDTAAASALTAGFGYFRMVAEYISPRSFQKDLRILPIRNAFTVSMDPAALMPHGGDQDWNIISVKMKRAEYKRRYPRAPNVSWVDIGVGDDSEDWEDKESLRLAEYFRIREKPDTLYLFRGQGQEFTKYASELRDPVSGARWSIDEVAAALSLRGMTIEGERESVTRQVEWFRLNGTKVVERQQLPGTYIPVFRVEGRATDMDGTVRRRGMVEAMMDAQRMVNYGEVAKVKRLGLTPKAPWVAAEGQLDGHPEWTDANTKAYPVLTYKPVILETSAGPVMLPPPARQAPAGIEQGFSEFVQGMRSNLMALGGTPNEPGQDPQNGAVVSGVALKRRQWLSDQSHFRYYDNTTLAIAQLWRVMLEWIPVYFSEARMQRIIGEDSTPQMVAINQPEQDPENEAVSKVKNDLTVGMYDVVMDTGPGYETKREEGAEALTNLLKIPPLAETVAKVGSDLVFRSIDHPYMQELADRIAAATPDGLKKVMEGLSARAQAVIKAIAGENAALKQKLQTVEQDLKAGITKAHIQAVVKAHEIEERNKTERMSDAGWQAEERHDTHVKADTALKVAEISAASRILDSHVKARHETEAAERMLEAGESQLKEKADGSDGT